MAEDRANDPARRPNLGLPNFVQTPPKKAKPVIKKITVLPPALDTNSESNDEIILAKKHLLDSHRDYKGSKDE